MHPLTPYRKSLPTYRIMNVVERAGEAIFKLASNEVLTGDPSTDVPAQVLVPSLE
jgi:hypothetical protein